MPSDLDHEIKLSKSKINPLLKTVCNPIHYTEFVPPEGKSLCFTGHRAERFFNNDASELEKQQVRFEIQAKIAYLTEQAINDGYVNFYSGMASGFDLWAAETVMTLAQNDFIDKNISLIACMPYCAVTTTHGDSERYLLWQTLRWASKVVYMFQNYSKQCFAVRNDFMVSNSSRIIAGLKEQRSGTGQTVRMAQKKNIEVVLLDI